MGFTVTFSYMNMIDFGYIHPSPTPANPSPHNCSTCTFMSVYICV